MTTLPDPLDVAVIIARALDAVGVTYTIGGSIASSMAGEPRSTSDIDFAVAMDEGHVAPLVARLDDEFYISADALTHAVRERRSVDIGGRRLFVHSPEDILLQKLRWFRLGGEISDRQWRDMLGIVRLQCPRLDRAYLESQAPILDVADLLHRTLSS